MANLQGGVPLGGQSSAESSMSWVGTGQLLGTNQLQTAIDKFTTAVDKLEQIASKLGGNGGSTNGGGNSLGGQQQGGSNSMPWYQLLRSPGQSWPGQQQPGNGGGKGFNQNARSNGGQGQGFAGQVQQQFGDSNPVSGQAGGTPAGGVLNNMAGSSSSAVAGAGMLGAAAMNFGTSQLSTQVGMSSFVQTNSLMSNSTGQANNNSIRWGAFGNGNSGLNYLSMGAQDAWTGQNIINQASGTPYYMGNQYASGMQGSASMFGLSNQGLSFAQSAQLAATMYNPQTSMNMRMAGFSTTPLMTGGGTNNMAQVFQGMMQRMYQGRSSVSPSTLAFSARQGGNANIDITAAFGAQNAPDVTTALEAYNQVQSRNPDMSASTIQNYFNQAGKGNNGAVQWLAKNGVQTSDIQSIKDLQSTQTGRSSDIANSFNDTLQASVTALQQFNQMLNSIINIPGINGIVGGGAGIGGALGGLTSGASMGLGIAGGMKLFGGLGSVAGGKILPDFITGEGGVAGIMTSITPLLTAAIPVIAPLAVAALAAGGATAIANKIAPGGATTAQKVANSNSPAAAPLLNLGSGVSAVGNVASDWANNFTGGISSAWHDVLGVLGGAGSTGPNGQTTASNTTNGGGASGAANTAIKDAESQIGVPYVWGGETPGQGFDCSGLVQWSYAQAGVNLPRTSQQQWSALQNKSVNLNSVQAGDLIFTAGSDGTEASPGHVAMMISNNQLIQAEETGVPIGVWPYNPSQWQHAARPVGGATAGTAAGASTAAVASLSTQATGAGTTGNYGSSDELANITSSLVGGVSGVTTGLSGGTTSTSTSTSTSPNTSGITGGGNTSTNKSLMQQLATAYGWGAGNEWSSLNSVVMAESGYNQFATNPQSGAYGIAQALPPSKYPKAGQPASMGGSSDPKTQEVWMLDYIKGTYTDPNAAWAHEQADHWYAGGTSSSRPGPAVVGENGPEIVNLPTGAQVLPMKGPQTLGLLPSISAAQGGKAGSSFSPTINLHFHSGAVCIQSGLQSAQQTSDAANELVQQVVVQLGKADILNRIRGGVLQSG